MSSAMEIGEYIIELLSSILANRSPKEKPENLSWEMIYDLSVRHGVSNMVCYAIEKLEKQPETNIMLKFSADRDIGIVREMNQEYEACELLESFEQNHIKNMPLKGYILKHMYPNPDMRTMSDIDILVKETDKDIFNNIMILKGYDFKVESAHEYVYIKKPYVNIELHKSLVPNYNKLLYNYYGNGWQTAKPVAGSLYKYEMSPEDFYIYMIVHFAKHYMQAGIGIRHVMDIYIYMQKSNLDKVYIRNELNKLNLLKFNDSVSALSEVWFGSKSYNRLTIEMSAFIIDSGSYGNMTNKLKYEMIKDSNTSDFQKSSVGKKNKIINIIFLPLDRLKVKYTILNRYPFLYPFIQIIRWIDVLMHRKKSLHRLSDAVTMRTAELDEYKAHFNSIGLDKIL